ncbi:MAG TPA: hypothetical protein VGM98_17110 [Schlesneria sp.]|jgi:hypothetical protein
MASKSQRQKERHTRKRQEKKKKQQGQQGQSRGRPFEIPAIAVGSNERHRQRLSQQLPRAWVGEAPEDVAVFDDAVLAALSPDLAQQVSIVRKALQDTTESRGEEAVKSVSVISRSSPLSEWRLFIRGLVDWLAGDSNAAGEAWQRLDRERRPGRIATAMMIALRSDLEHVTPSSVIEASAVTSQAAPFSQWDDQLLYHGKLLHRVRFDRAALRVAEAGVHAQEESSELLLGPGKLRWVKLFAKEYGDTEPDLAAALLQTALGRAFAQPYSDMFDEAAQSIPGPRHDPKNQLLTFVYYSRFADKSSSANRSQRALERYLNIDLPQNEGISKPLRGAIASEIHFYEAQSLMQPTGGRAMFDRFYAPSEDPKAIRKHLQSALKADATNLSVYKGYIDWLKSKLDDYRLTPSKAESLEKERAEVMRKWSQSRPEDVEPRLWLVDFFLENEQLEEARPHVEHLAASRLEDPRVRATPWKWQLLEAMRLCRRKAWLAEVPARLNEADTIWPGWLSKQWLPYLRAALTLRIGQVDEFESQRQQISQASGVAHNSLADACMMLGAAQRMRVSAANLKPLRATLELVLKQLKTLPIEELMEAGSFFWDLHRTQLIYPAYRLHGRQIGKELFARLTNDSKPVLNHIDDEAVHKAVLWGSETRYWSTSYNTKKLPFFSKPAIQRHPMFVAARVNAYLHERYHWGQEDNRKLSPILREAATSQRDPYYRFWFVKLANDLDDELAALSSSPFGFNFDKMFGNSDSNGDFDDDVADDEWNFDHRL